MSSRALVVTRPPVVTHPLRPRYRGHVRQTVLRVVLAIAWLIAALLLALGSAGIIASVGGPPGSANRPELTWVGDRQLEPELSSALSSLERISADVDALGLQGRLALATLISRDLDALDAAIAAGTTLAESVEDRSAALRIRLIGLPGLAPDAALRYSTELRGRQGALLAALDVTQGLRTEWLRLTIGASAAENLALLLGDHDRYAADAAASGRAAGYPEALAKLDAADAAIDAIRPMRDRLAQLADVTVLNQWIGRNTAYDAALRDLYEELVKSKGRSTAAVKEAVEAEKRAREQLPPDTRALVVIMTEVARGGLNQAVIAIEQAKGRLAAAVEALGGTVEPAESPAAEPSPLASPPASPSAAPSGEPSPSAASSAEPSS